LRLHELSEFVEVILAEEKAVGREMRLSRPVERWLEVNGAPVLGSNGRRHGTVLVFHDLTRLKQLENTRKDFVANVSHELRTPLSLIKGCVETLLGAKDNPDAHDQVPRTISATRIGSPSSSRTSGDLQWNPAGFNWI
jgi:two-component system phosphate regulon sensor histidine kinase PhoR